MVLLEHAGSASLGKGSSKCHITIASSRRPCLRGFAATAGPRLKRGVSPMTKADLSILWLPGAVVHPFLMQPVLKALYSLGAPSSLGPYGNLYRFCLFGVSSAITSLVLFGLLVRLLGTPHRLSLAVACVATFFNFYVWPLVQQGWWASYANFIHSPAWNSVFAFFVVLLPWLVGRHVVRWANKAFKRTGFARRLT